MSPQTPKPQEKGWENLHLHNQSARDVPGHPGDLQGTLRGPKKNDNLMKKVLFRFNGYCSTHLLLFFTAKTNMQKF